MSCAIGHLSDFKSERRCKAASIQHPSEAIAHSQKLATHVNEQDLDATYRAEDGCLGSWLV
jgi:hypothetical protein